MTRSLAEIYALYCQRRAGESAQHTRWRDLANIYDGGLVTPLPEYDEVAESAVPGLVAQGIDSYTRRAASTQPDVQCPALRPNIAASRRKAEDRRRVIRGWWQGSEMALADYQRYRFLFGYGQAPVVIRHHPAQVGVPRVEVRNPMGCYPGPRDLPYSPVVPDCFMAVVRSARWVKDNYGVDFGPKVHRDMLVEVVEYIDAEQVTIFCTGPASDVAPVRTATAEAGIGTGTYGGYWSERGTHIERIGAPGASGGWLIGLSSTPNYAGMCTVSAPGSISLSKAGGLVDNILGMHKLQARLMGLTVKAIAKGIFPNEWVVTDPSQNGRGVVVDANGAKGIVGHIDGGNVVMNQIQPGYQTWNMLDRLEANQRSTAGIVPQLGGSNPVNVRTGRASDGLQVASVDPVIREAHEIISAAREHEVRIMVAHAKGYGGSRSRSFYVTEHREKRRIEYVATDLFETDEATVAYSMAGADAQGLIIEAAQSVGTGMLSKHDARVLNPLVEDIEATEIAIRTEALEEVVLGSLAGVAQASPEDAAFILKRVREGAPLEDVVIEQQRRAQERQASAGALGAPDGPVEPGAAAAQPGLGVPGGGGQVPEQVAQPAPSLRNLAALYTATRRPAQTSPAERAAS